MVVNDLLPNTVYNISIVGVSTGNSFGILLGDNTTSITITTLTGGEYSVCMCVYSILWDILTIYRSINQ